MVQGSITSRIGSARSTATYQEHLRNKKLIERYERELKEEGEKSNQRICGGSCGQMNCVIF
jgi:hypothetical protein